MEKKRTDMAKDSLKQNNDGVRTDSERQKEAEKREDFGSDR